MRRVLIAGIAAVFAGLAAGACGTDAFGIEACRQIENARCKYAPHCPNINLGVPVHRDSPKTDIDACIRYYRDACLHGLVTPPDPGQVAINGCIDAINEGDCNVVERPELHPKCAFLIPPAPPPTPDASADAPDGAPDAAATDAATEGG
jgi:hypothetical protein